MRGLPSLATNYVVFKHVTELGERLPVVIGSDTGCPAILALRFGLRMRNGRGSATLEQSVRRIAELYEWFAVENLDLDEYILAEHELNPSQLVLALDDLEDWMREEAYERGQPPPDVAWVRNARISAWSAFAQFLSIPDYWRRAPRVNESDEQREHRRERIDYLIQKLENERVSTLMPARREPLSKLELEAIAEALDPSSGLCPFRGDTLPRNRALVNTLRWLGVRIGEALKIKTCDIPDEETPADKLLRELEGEARFVRIVRRPDDPNDPRKNEPRVKRGDREIASPDDIVEELITYRRLVHGSKDGKSVNEGYLYLTDDKARPLSQSRAEKLIPPLRFAATLAFERRNPGKAHSLSQLVWHRFRHTRAIELLPAFFPDMVETDSGKQAFLEYFGWANERGAIPYLRRLRTQQAARILSTHKDALQRG